MRGNAYTFKFAAIVCVACSLVVSAAATLLRERQEFNARIDMQKNILRAVGFLREAGKSPTSADIQSLYGERIRELVLAPDGSRVEGVSVAELDPESYLDPKRTPGKFPLFVSEEEGRPTAYAFPIVGKGLWSTLYGYLAIAPDGETVKGITFYKHGETPGLGAEIEQDWFQENFEGKKVFDDSGSLKPVAVVKGRAAERYSGEALEHYVDGISGATITSQGVTALLSAALERYEPFLRKVRQGGRAS